MLLTNLLARVIQVFDLKDEIKINLLDQLLKIIQIFINAAVQADMSESDRAEKLKPKPKESKEEVKEQA